MLQDEEGLLEMRKERERKSREKKKRKSVKIFLSRHKTQKGRKESDAHFPVWHWKDVRFSSMIYVILNCLSSSDIKCSSLKKYQFIFFFVDKLNKQIMKDLVKKELFMEIVLKRRIIFWQHWKMREFSKDFVIIFTVWHQTQIW